MVDRLGFVTHRVKREKRHFSTRCVGQNGVDPEIYLKTMTVIQALKPTVLGRAGRHQRPSPTESSVKMATAQRGGDGDVIKEERDQEQQTYLPVIQTTTGDGGEGTRKSVTRRWQRAVAAAITSTAHSNSNSDPACLATGEKVG